MPTLHSELTRAEIVRLQQRLDHLGFRVGPIDGVWGPKTEAAVQAFQRSQHLRPDGIVGPLTQEALFAAEPVPTMTLSEKAIQLILEFEVGGGSSYYNRHLLHPIWPQASSGVTIGIGYDLGYNPRHRFEKDWLCLPEGDRIRLGDCCGLKGEAAQRRIGSVKDIVVPWDIAWQVFQAVTIPRFYRDAAEAFPGLLRLPLDAQGALVSLVFNRGPSMEGPKRLEMRLIREMVPRQDLPGIAEQLRNMKRLWVGTSVERGLSRRRDAEAALLEGALHRSRGS